MQENEVKFGEKSENSQKHGFCIDISEATVRDFDLNPGACESSGLELSHAQEFGSIPPTRAALMAFHLPLTVTASHSLSVLQVSHRVFFAPSGAALLAPFDPPLA